MQREEGREGREGREGEERGGEMQRGEEKRGGRGGERRAEQWYQWYVAHAIRSTNIPVTKAGPTSKSIPDNLLHYKVVTV